MLRNKYILYVNTCILITSGAGDVIYYTFVIHYLCALCGVLKVLVAQFGGGGIDLQAKLKTVSKI